MKVLKKVNIIIVLICLSLFSCKDKKEFSKRIDPQKARYYNNQQGFSSINIDSTQVLNKIVGQKLQEIFDLTIFTSNLVKNNDKDSLLIYQIRSYFDKIDSVESLKFYTYIDSLDIDYSKIFIDNLDKQKYFYFKDSIGEIKFKVDFYNKKKNVFSDSLRAKYVIKKDSVEKNGFKFYFIKIGKKIKN